MYQINKHTAWFAQVDSPTWNRYELARKLSKDFTIENQKALELDNALMEYMRVQTSAEPEREQKSSTKSKVAASTKNELTERFEELFEELKKLKPNTSVPINKEEIIKGLQDALSKVKIRYNDLDQEVKELLESKSKTIRYELPDRKLPEFTKPPIASFQQIVDDMMIGNNVFLVGGAGTGKTYMAENLIAKMALGRKHITINCSQWTSPIEIIGGQTMDGYVEGKLIEAWKNGYVLILDELPKIDPNTAGLFNDALAKSKLDNAVIFNGRKESFSKHPDFACIATGNIYPDKESMSYGANNKQDLSLLDRFSGSVYFIEKNPAIEKQIIQNEMIWSICDKMRSVIEELKYEAQLSLRFMQTARDAFALEEKRLKDKKANGVKADEGKTFKSAVDSYLSTFTSIQQKNIKDKIRYEEIFKNYAYRNFNINQSVY